MGKLESSHSSRVHYRRLITRIEAVSNDPRYAFMFANANVGGDTMADILRHLFRLQPDSKPMTVMQLAGIPAEVVDVVVSVLCRMAFDFGLWSDGAIELLLICEEAHRYVSADRSMGFQPTRRVLSRIAKEGRTHGIFLGLVTQRPAEIDETIISQCSTLFAMRMGNERDQQLVQAAASDAGQTCFGFCRLWVRARFSPSEREWSCPPGSRFIGCPSTSFRAARPRAAGVCRPAWTID